MSTAGASVLGFGYLLPAIYFPWSIFWGEPAGPNPWRAKGLEWQVPSPPTTFNFDDGQPVVVEEAYNYRPEEEESGAY
jgi:cytochrome c oxidase subunit 1